MSVEERLASLESDVKHIRTDTAETRQDIKTLNNKIDDGRADLQSFKTEVVKEFGKVGVSIESLKTSIEKSKLWMLVTGLGVVMSTVVTVAHALKLF